MHDLGGKSYRLLQNNLDNDIVADESKILVKKDKVIIKLQKVRSNEPARPPAHPLFVLCMKVLRLKKLKFLWMITDVLRAVRSRLGKLALVRRVLVGLFLCFSRGVPSLANGCRRARTALRSCSPDPYGCLPLN